MSLKITKLKEIMNKYTLNRYNIYLKYIYLTNRTLVFKLLKT
jgi:hypothetical protein